MNGYKIMSEAYRKAAEEGKISQERAAKECRIYDFLATCDKADINILFDSSAFNEITKAYLQIAAEELTADKIINESQGQAIINRFCHIFEERSAGEV